VAWRAGNPVSTIVCFHLFVRAAIEKRAGAAAPGLRRVHVKVAAPIKLDQERPEYHRVTLAWRAVGTGGYFVARSTGFQRSSRLLSVRSTTGLLELPQGSPEPGLGTIEEGSFVPCLLIGDLQGMPV
jgi:gephyrin